MLDELGIILPAFLAGVCIILVHIPLGIEVVKRGIIFIDLSIAQLAAMGAFLATMIGHNHEHGEPCLESFIMVQIFAFASAILGGLFFMYIEKKHKNIEETVIGSVFVLSATLVMLVLSQNPHAGEHLKELLAGQLLFVSYKQIVISLVAIFAISLIVTRYYKTIFQKYFYIIFAMIITITVQMAGIYLVFATLIFPALGVYYIKNAKNKIFLSYIGGILGLGLGLFGALMLDLSAGPAAVWGIAFVMIIIFVLSVVRKDKCLS